MGLYTGKHGPYGSVQSQKVKEEGHLVGRKKKSLLDRELEVLSARVRFDLYKDVEKIAKNEGLTLTQVVRRAVVDFVANRKKHPQAAS